jgi:hypothetical protein
LLFAEKFSAHWFDPLLGQSVVWVQHAVLLVTHTALVFGYRSHNTCLGNP